MVLAVLQLDVKKKAMAVFEGSGEVKQASDVVAQ